MWSRLIHSFVESIDSHQVVFVSRNNIIQPVIVPKKSAAVRCDDHLGQWHVQLCKTTFVQHTGWEGHFWFTVTDKTRTHPTYPIIELSGVGLSEDELINLLRPSEAERKRERVKHSNQPHKRKCRLPVAMTTAAAAWQPSTLMQTLIFQASPARWNLSFLSGPGAC